MEKLVWCLFLLIGVQVYFCSSECVTNQIDSCWQSQSDISSWQLCTTCSGSPKCVNITTLTNPFDYCVLCASPSPSITPTTSATPTSSVTPSVSPTRTPSSTSSPSPSITPSASPSITPSITPTITPTTSVSPTSSTSPSASSSVSSTPSKFPTPSVSPSISPPVTPTSSPSASDSGGSTPTSSPASGASSSSSPGAGTQNDGNPKKKNDSVVIGAVVGAIGGAVFLGLIVGLAFRTIKRREPKDPSTPPAEPIEMQPVQAATTGYEPISAATGPYVPIPGKQKHSSSKSSSSEETSSESSSSEEDSDDNAKSSKKLSRGKTNPRPSSAVLDVGIKADDIIEGRLLGEGQFGLVYQAIWRSATVIIKKIKLENEKARKEFLEEAQLIKQIRPHPNVVQFFGVCEDPLMIVNEYLEGGSLEKFLDDKSKPLPIETAMNIIKGIASGMYHLASENIVHRDLAARNVLLTSSLTPKINDFGLSRLLQKNDEYLSNAQSLPLKWLAPESMQLSDQVYSEKSDVWSFGITCIEILTRDRPYPTMDAIDVVFLTRTGKLKPTIPDNVPASLKTILEMCFDFDPQKRPTFQDICKMMEHAN